MKARYLILAPLLLLGLGAVSYGDGLISAPCFGLFCQSPATATDGQLPIGSSTDGRVHMATITAGTNVTITNGHGSITINASGGSGSGCIPPGSSGKVLYDDGAGNCLDTSGVTSNGTKLTFANGALDLAGSGSGDALLNAPATGGGTLTLPTGTDTIAGIAATQTLTNKTISGSSNTLSNIANASLTNSSITIAGHSVSLGGTQAIACADLSNGATGCSTATGTSGAVIPLLNAANTWSGIQSFNDGDILLNGSSSGTLSFKCAAICGTSVITFPAGTTNFSATGGTSQVVKQTSSGGALTVAQLGCVDLSTAASGCSTATGTSGATMPLLNGTNTWSGVQSFNDGDFLLKGLSSGTLTLKCAAVCGTRTITFPAGTTDFSATGGTGQVVQQSSSGAALTVGTLAATQLSDYVAGTSFTPTFTASGTPPTSVTYSTQTGRYMSIGKLVWLNVSVTLTSKGTGATGVGRVDISASGVSAANSGFCSGTIQNVTFTGTPVPLITGSVIQFQTEATGTTVTNITWANYSDTSIINATCVFEKS